MVSFGYKKMVPKWYFISGNNLIAVLYKIQMIIWNLQLYSTQKRKWENKDTKINIAFLQFLSMFTKNGTYCIMAHNVNKTYE